MRFLLEVRAGIEAFPGVQGKLRKTATVVADETKAQIVKMVTEQGGRVLIEAELYPVMVVEMPQPPAHSGLVFHRLD